MRANIRRTSLDALHSDAEAALAQLTIDESATYTWTVTIRQPGQPTTERTETVPGRELARLIRAQLLTSMHEIEQDDTTGTITTRWTRQSKRNNYRTQEAVFTKLTNEEATELAARAAATPRVPAHVLDEPARFVSRRVLPPAPAAPTRRRVTVPARLRACGGCFQVPAANGTCGC
ncbi:hypothetical protein ACFOOM_00990 [Streptomyces echinoruber]|uniref:Uncharacterized protein n=1 Tax=Streptomyces echinoruber TaxID=68898 RepID=A0A918QXN0_9ACTN|nr:hypothetical protein [Streptomyces echinoruber]GGZ73182.1 hypothetical protein GCM10010389_08360 [Streptomyces echinoruber]